MKKGQDPANPCLRVGVGVWVWGWGGGGGGEGVGVGGWGCLGVSVHACMCV